MTKSNRSERLSNRSKSKKNKAWRKRKRIKKLLKINRNKYGIIDKKHSDLYSMTRNDRKWVLKWSKKKTLFGISTLKNRQDAIRKLDKELGCRT